MAQRFLFSAAARSLSLAEAIGLSDTGVEDVFLRLRWPETDGKPVCPDCGCPICHPCRRLAGQLRWRCKACRRDVSITSGTRFAMQRINHQDGYSIGGACTNGAESCFSRLRRGELGHHHHIAGPYLVRYAQEAAWREGLRRVSNGEQAHGVIGLALRSSPSVDFCWGGRPHGIAKACQGLAVEVKQGSRPHGV